MVGLFLNYYAPEGYGGVITANPLQSESDFYDLRTPQEAWHHGEAMITTNRWTDGTYTPSDEDFGVDSYYGDESPKTLESHWDLLHYDGSGSRGGHQLSLAYRDKDDMTIWFDGRISKSGDKTPRLEWEWKDLFFEPPLIPNIVGSTSGKIGEEQIFKFSAIDPDGDDISYCIDWGDESGEVCVGPFPSGIEQTSSHTWNEEGTYTIKVKARDIHGAESDWATLTVSMPKSKSNRPFGFIFVFGFDVDVKIVQLEPGEDYVDLEVLSKPFYIWENEIQTRNPGEFIRLYNAKGLFSPSLPVCFGICDDWGIIG